MAEEKVYTEQEVALVIEKEREEAVRQANMSVEEKVLECQAKKEQELNERERQITMRERVIEAQAMLAERNLPVSFAEVLACESPEETALNVKMFDEAFREAVAVVVSEKLKGITPAAGLEDAAGCRHYTNRYLQASNMAERSKIKREAFKEGFII